jgi:(p)ppGpp synthase/HD superfamily hydrolase
VQMHPDSKASIFFELSLSDLSHLHEICRKIEALDGVLTAERYRF